jgi:hypothetical protein
MKEERVSIQRPHSFDVPSAKIPRVEVFASHDIHHLAPPTYPLSPGTQSIIGLFIKFDGRPVFTKLPGMKETEGGQEEPKHHSHET